MGFARKFGLSLACIILISSLIITNLLLTVSLSLEQETVKTEFNSIAKEVINSDTKTKSLIDRNLVYAKNECKNKTVYNFSYEGIEAEIPCSVINNGTDAVIDYAVENSFDDIYYKNYSCEMWECAKENPEGIPSVLISEEAKNYWHSKFLICLAVSLFLIIAVFLLASKKSGAFITIGVTVLLSSLPLIAAKRVISLIPESIASKAASIFFTKASFVFWIVLISGITLIIVGLALKLANIWTEDETKDKKKSK
jgi:uncharacterized protein YpmS